MAVQQHSGADWPSVPMRLDGVQWRNRYRSVLALSDLLAVMLALAITPLFRIDGIVDLSPNPSTAEVAGAVFIGTVWLVSLTATESRGHKYYGAGLEEYRRVIHASFYALGAVAIASYLVKAEISRLVFLVALPVGLAFLLFGRWLCRLMLVRLRARGRAVTKTVVVGGSSQVAEAVRDMWANPSAGYVPVAVSIVRSVTHEDGWDEDVDGGTSDVLAVGLPKIDYAQLPLRLAAGGIEAVVIAGGLSRHETRRLSWRLEGSPLELLLVPRIADVAGPRLSASSVEGLQLMHVALPRFSGWSYHVKRTLDIAMSLAALLVLAPLMAVIAVAIKLDSDGGVIFRQERVGHRGEPFVIHKFRTMVVDAESRLAGLRDSSIGNGVLFKLDEDPRVTRVGRLLRRFSLDELPQFWTVLKGDMSIVGPRPHLEAELAEFPDHALRRLLIKPGITGLWQVNGRSDLSLEESVRLDLRYVENWSLSGDLSLVLKTVGVVFRKSGAY